MVRSVVFLILVLALFSCQRSLNVNEILSGAESVMETAPDSALVLLKSIDFPEELAAGDYASYLLLMTQAKNKNSLDIAEDTLISVAADYFLKKNDISRAALSCFYFGRVLNAKGNAEAAIQQLLIAKEYAEQVGNYNLLGLIYYDLGYIYQTQFNYPRAVENYTLAKENFRLSGNRKNEIYSLGYIGNVYISQQPPQIDSAFFYYNTALMEAEKEENPVILAETLKNLGLAYSETGEYDKAKEYTLKSMQEDKTQTYAFFNHITLCNIFTATGQIDSAFHYSQYIPGFISEDDLFFGYTYHTLLAGMHKAQHNYDAVILEYENLLQLSESISGKYKDQSIMNIQEKYMNEKLKTSLQRATIQRQYFIISITIGTIVIILLIGLYKTTTSRKNKKIAEIEQKVDTLNEMLFDQGERKNKFKELLVDRLDISKKIAQLNLIPSNDKHLLLERYNRIFEKDLQHSLDWEYLYPIINELYDGFVDKITERYPILSEKEKQLCCLIHAEFRTDEISVILSYKYKSVSVLKSKLREKMGFATYEEFITYIKSI